MHAVALPKRLREAPPALFLYLAGVFALGFTIDGGIYSVLQNLYLLRLGYGPEFIGAYNSAGLFIFALLSLPIGSIRRWSSRRLLLTGATLTFCGMLTIPLAHWVAADWQAAALMGGRVISLTGLSFFFVHSAPFLLGITSGDWQNRSLAWQSATLSTAGFAGGMLGGYLPGWIASAAGLTLRDVPPYQLPLLLAAVMLAVTFIAIWRTPEPILEAVTPSQTAADDPVPVGATWDGRPIWLLVGMITLVRILQVAAPGALLTFTNVYFDAGLGVSTNIIGIVTAGGRLASVPMALITPWLMARWGGFRMVIWTSLMSVVAALPLALPTDLGASSAGFVVSSGIGPIRYMSFLLFTFSLVSPGRRAIISGAGEMSIGMGFAIVALAGGFIITSLGYSALFVASLAATLAGTILFWVLFRRYR